MALARSQSKVIKITPNLAADSVAATNAYADKDVIGDHLTVENVAQSTKGTALLQSVVVRTKVATAVPLSIYLLNEAPANAYGANNSAFALDDTDLLKVVGVVAVAAADYDTSNTLNYVATVKNIGLPLQCLAGSKNLYAIVVARGAVTFGAAGDLEIDLGFLQD